MTNPVENSSCSASFTVCADCDPSVLSRVIEYFVVLDVLPDYVRSKKYADGTLEVTVRVRGMDEDRMEIVAHKLRQIVTVHHVGLEIFAVGGDIRDYRDLKMVAAQ